MTGMACHFDITKHTLFYHPNRGSCAVLELFHWGQPWFPGNSKWTFWHQHSDWQIQWAGLTTISPNHLPRDHCIFP